MLMFVWETKLVDVLHISVLLYKQSANYISWIWWLISRQVLVYWEHLVHLKRSLLIKYTNEIQKHLVCEIRYGNEK